MSRPSPEAVAALITAIAALITAIAALVSSLRAHRRIGDGDAARDAARRPPPG